MSNRSKFKFCFDNGPFQVFRRLKHAKTSHKKLGNVWKGVVGLEIHAQLNNKSKLFSGSSTQFGCPVNSNVSLFDASLPGTLPVLNKKCVEMGVLSALCLGCELNETSFFDRKHYFYADLPAGYQITQHRTPLAKGGLLNFPVFNPTKYKTPYYSHSRIIQLQLEQDSGKSLHDEESQRSLIDLNRAGIPLIEIVFAPDLSDGEEAAALVKELVLILTKINTSSCKMEEGALRVDANVSVHKPGESLGVRTEIKNIGSIRAVANAIDYEIDRQKKLLSSGHDIENETRAWNADTCETVAMRDKEAKQDYRFMPEPNLPPLRLNMSSEINGELVNVSHIRSAIPELPEETRNNIKSTYGLQADLIFHLVSEGKLLDTFKEVMAVKSRDPRQVACLLTMDLMTLVNKGLTSLEDKQFSGILIGEITDLLQEKEINLVTARKIMEEVALGNLHSPRQIVSDLGLRQITDSALLRDICRKVIDENPSIVAKYRSGQTKVFPALLGIVAKRTNNQAKMDLVVKLFKEMLD